MTTADVATIREALTSCMAHAHKFGLGPEWANAREALACLDRLAARVGENWCFDMEMAPRDGTPSLFITTIGTQRVDYKVPDLGRSQYFWHEVPAVPYVAWRPLPQPPETDDE